MKQLGSAIVFTNSSMGPSPMLGGVLRELGLPAVLPHQLSGNSNGVSVVIIERSLDRAETICVNLRRYKEYSEVPILVLAESVTPSKLRRFEDLKAEVLPPPVSEEAVRNFLTEKLLKPSSQGDRPDNAPPEATQPDAPPPRETETRAAPTEAGPGLKPHRPAGGAPRVGKTVVKEVRKVVRPPSDLPDDNPSSPRLLEGSPDAAQLPKGSVRCAYCPRWLVRREDPFCSRCGSHLIALDPVAPQLVFEPRGNHYVGKLIGLKNTGQNPLRARFRIVADEEMESRLSLSAREAVLAGGAAGDLLVALDARGLDLSSSYEAALEIETNEKRGSAPHVVRLCVEQLARPRIITNGEYVYSLNAAHQPNQWEFGLANEGGRTLSLKGVQMVLPGGNGDGTTLELLSPAPVNVGGGQTVPVRVRFPDLTLSSDHYKGKLTCLFEQHEPLSVDLAFEAKQPRYLRVQSADFIDFEGVSTQGSKTVALNLSNIGEENLRISSISHAPPFPWLTLSENLSLPFVMPRFSSLAVDLRVNGAPELVGVHEGELVISSDSYRNEVLTIPFVVEFQEPEEFDGYMGVDFGTTASCVAVLEKDELRLITIDHYGEQRGKDGTIMPSVLYFLPNGDVLAGHEAYGVAQNDPRNAVRAIKRALGMHDKKRLAGRDYDSTELAALVIKELRERAEPALSKAGKYNKKGRYKTPKRAVLTVPVDFAEKQRRALLEASSRSGLDDTTPSKYPTVLDEALAVALYYQRMRRGAKPAAGTAPERLLVFDFGGGTLDCGLIEIKTDGRKLTFRTLATYGDSNLGGEDIDWALVELLAAKAAKEYEKFDGRCLRKPEEPAEIEGLYRREEYRNAAYRMRDAFKEQAEQAKIALGQAPEFSLRLDPLMRRGGQSEDLYITHEGKPVTFETTLQQEEFEQVLRVRGGVTPADVTTILHAGRSSLIPQLKDGVNAFLPQAADRTEIIKPKVCVALGAAFYARLRTSHMKDFEIVGGANRVVHDIGYISEGLQRAEFVPVIPAQTPFPTAVEVRLPADGDIDLQVAENRGLSNLVGEGNSDIIYGDVFHIHARDGAGEDVPVIFKVNDDGLLGIVVDGKEQPVMQMGD
jgi:molecular chaperone DnaK (HSP70)